MTQGAAEIEDLKRRLEVAETELKLALEGSGGQKDAEELTEGGSGQKEGRVDVEVVQLEQRSGRKSRRSEEFFLLNTLVSFCIPQVFREKYFKSNCIKSKSAVALF